MRPGDYVRGLRGFAGGQERTFERMCYTWAQRPHKCPPSASKSPHIEILGADPCAPKFWPLMKHRDKMSVDDSTRCIQSQQCVHVQHRLLFRISVALKNTPSPSAFRSPQQGRLSTLRAAVVRRVSLTNHRSYFQLNTSSTCEGEVRGVIARFIEEKDSQLFVELLLSHISVHIMWTVFYR